MLAQYAINILQLGFSGVVFILALFAYWLLRREQNKTTSREEFQDTIDKFMKFYLALAILTMVSPILPKLFEEKPNLLMEAAIESAKNRKPLPLEFVKSQIAALTEAHNQRLESLYNHRTNLENLINSATDENKVREIEKSLRRANQNIRDENQEYDSKVSKFTYSL